MSMPGYSAEASLYITGRSYRANTGAPGSSMGSMVVTQQDSTCSVCCSEWQGCNEKCGSWPPGFSNADCWLNCLKPCVDCLNQNCGARIVDCTTKGCPPGKICCDCISPAKCTDSKTCFTEICKL